MYLTICLCQKRLAIRLVKSEDRRSNPLLFTSPNVSINRQPIPKRPHRNWKTNSYRFEMNQQQKAGSKGMVSSVQAWFREYWGWILLSRWKLSQVDGACGSFAMWFEFSHGIREVLGSNHRSAHILFLQLWHLVAQCVSMFGQRAANTVPNHCSCEPISLPNIPSETQSTCENVSKAYETISLWITLRPVMQQTPGRYLCCKSICTNIIFSWWEKTETQCSVLEDAKVLYPTTLFMLFGK